MSVGQLVAVALSVFLLLGSVGWGAVGARVLRRIGWSQAASVIGVPLEAGLGLAVVTSIGGVLVAAHVAYPIVLVVIEAFGCVAALMLHWRRVGEWLRLRIRPSRLPIALIVLGGIAASTAVALGWFSSFYYNINDDDPGYVYLAQRIVSTGALIDPFNQRRITDFGAASLFQAVYLRYSGNGSLQGFDELFGALLLIVLVVGGRKRALKILGSLAVAGVVLLGNGVGPIVNLTPVYVSTALILATYEILARAVSTNGRARFAAFLGAGLTASALLSIRESFYPAVLLVALAAIVSRVRIGAIVRALGGFALGSIVGIVGWSVAEFESSHTPLFPLIAGYYTGEPSSRNSADTTLSPILHLARQVASRGAIGWVCVATILVGAVCLIARRRRAQAGLVVVAGIAGLFAIVFNSYVASGFAVLDLWRYVAASVTAAALFALDLVWSAAPAANMAVHRRAWRRRSAGSWLVALCSVAVGAGLLALIGDTSPVGYRQLARYELTQWRDGARLSGIVDHYPAELRAEYAEISAAIPPGAKVFTAVDAPALLDLSRLQIATLDLPGAVSPPPHMPYFKGFQAKVDYLRQLGYRYLIVSSPTAFGFYERAQWQASLTTPPVYAEALASYMLDWIDSVAEIEADRSYPQASIGVLTVIKIG